jgi:hypothetical protein
LALVGYKVIQLTGPAPTIRGYRSSDSLLCLLDITYIGGEGKYLDRGLSMDCHFPAYIEGVLLVRDGSHRCSSACRVNLCFDTDAVAGGMASAQHDLFFIINLYAIGSS